MKKESELLELELVHGALVEAAESRGWPKDHPRTAAVFRLLHERGKAIVTLIRDAELPNPGRGRRWFEDLEDHVEGIIDSALAEEVDLFVKGIEDYPFEEVDGTTFRETAEACLRKLGIMIGLATCLDDHGIALSVLEEGAGLAEAA